MVDFELKTPDVFWTSFFHKGRIFSDLTPAARLAFWFACFFKQEEGKENVPPPPEWEKELPPGQQVAFLLSHLVDQKDLAAFTYIAQKHLKSDTFSRYMGYCGTGWQVADAVMDRNALMVSVGGCPDTRFLNVLQQHSVWPSLFKEWKAGECSTDKNI